MKRGILGLALLLLISILPAHSVTPPKAGAICAKLGSTKIFQSKKFTCIKSGKKLIWSKGLAIAKPTPTPTPTPTTTTIKFEYLPPSISSDPIEACKIKEASNSRGMTGAGFPEWNSLTPRFGTVKWALIPIDFPDLKGESNFRARVDDQMQLLSEWFDTVSEGRFKVEWVVAKDWVTLPKSSLEYTIGLSANLMDAPNGPKLFKDAMNSADPTFDFTNVQTVNFILPKNQNVIDETSQGFPWDKPVKELITNEGAIASYSIPGNFMSLPGKAYWSYWAHEFGHAIGLAHIGASRGEAAPFNALDLLGSQDGPDRELSGWLRFFAGWLPEERILCKELQNFKEMQLTLVPLSEREPGVKVAIIPINQRKALLVESRRATKFSCTTPTRRDGVLAYIYDATLGHNEDFLIPYGAKDRPKEKDSCGSQNNRSGPPVADYYLRTGEKVTVEGVTIEVLLHGNYDRVRISRN